MNRLLIVTLLGIPVCLLSNAFALAQEASELQFIRVSDDGTHFITSKSGQRITMWGVNYDHDGDGQLLEDYWHDHWDVVTEDFAEIKALGANVVRIHLQLPRFMKTADEPNDANLTQLKRLVELAERTGLYLDLTGLGCYHKQDVPSWYDALGETDRWAVQARFWQAVATVCHESPAVYCYDLMNEPILPGNRTETEWLTGELGGKHFVQRLSLDLAGRTREEVAAAWVRQMTSAIRDVDDHHMITVGVIPWAHVWKNAKPLFYSPEVGGPLDFVSVHFYPGQNDVQGSLDALKVYDIGKPLVVEEIFPLKCSLEEADQFIEGSREFTDGWISFYWGRTIQENEEAGTIQGAIIAQWLKYFQQHAPQPIQVPAQSSLQRPNILWIVGENLKLDLGCYGAQNVHIPHLDRLAAEVTRFTRVSSTSPVCAPSRSAFLTGMYQTSTDFTEPVQGKVLCCEAPDAQDAGRRNSEGRCCGTLPATASRTAV
ncbi:MAG: sulfatase-like hydrolase/transferase [Planctomycetaceae bacterium]|nr:sulfatase-like hydrolase/transferase [Planctomycetaceae bacterium]